MKYVTEHSDNEIIIMSKEELEEAKKSAEEFDGFLGFTILGRLDEKLNT